MAVTVTEACAINILLTALYGRQTTDDRAPSGAEIEKAALELAGSAHRRLAAGWSHAQLVQRIKQRREGPRP